MAAERYAGSELELFAGARHWKAYLASVIAPHLRGHVLEVGAGLGATTARLAREHDGSWTCLEPDPELAARVAAAISAHELPVSCDVRCARLGALPADLHFDTVLYVDVLEHIEDDVAEARLAAARLHPRGKLIVLSPAHAWLYSPFDRSIGHFRRYDRRTLRAVIPAELELVQLRYLDSVGLLASAGNRFLTRQAQPTARQIRLWDGVMVPLSRVADRLLGYRLGKSLLGVWQRGH